MRFDPDDRKYIFHTEKYMDESSVRTLLSQKKKWLSEEQYNHPDKKGAPLWANVIKLRAAT